MPKSVTELVRQLTLPHPWGNYETLAYLLEGEGGECALIDAGWGVEGCWASLKEELGILGHDPSEIKMVIITHSHPDHCGLAGELQRLGARVAMHEGDVPFLEERFLNPEKYRARMRGWLLMQGVPEGELGELLGSLYSPSLRIARPDLILKGGEVLAVAGRALRVLSTPGHTPGHICLYDAEERLLFAGDHLLPRVTPNISLQPYYDADPVGDYLASLKGLRELEVELVLPGHEGPFNGLRSRVEELLAHHEERLREVMRAVGRGEGTAWELAQRIAWSIGEFRRLDPLERRRALGETLAHLRYLELRGKIRSEERDGRLYFSLG